MIQSRTYAAIFEHTDHARRKHVWPADMTDAEKYSKAESELHEMAAAMLKGDARGVRHEALDCMAVLVRIIEGD